MDGHDSQVQKQSTADVTDLVQNLLPQLQSRFQTMSDSIISKIDEMGGRMNELEKSIDDRRTEMGIEGSPSSAPSNPRIRVKRMNRSQLMFDEQCWVSLLPPKFHRQDCGSATAHALVTL